MKGIHFMALVLAFFSNADFLLAQQPPVAAPRPSIRFDKLVHDFGRVNETEVLRCEFIITNTGTAPLVVSEVKPGCASCTTALPWDRMVEPGKTGKIPIEFRPRGFAGTVAKSVSVTCNDPLQAVHSLQVKATVWKPVDIMPAYLYFTGVEDELTNQTKTVRIINNMDEPLTLEAPQSNHPNLKTEFKTVLAGKEFELQVRYFPFVSNALPQGLISMKTSSTNAPVLSVTAFAMPQPAVVALPAAIRIPPGPLTPNYRQIITVRNNSSNPIAVSDPVISAEGISIQTTENIPGKSFTFHLAFASNFNARAEKPVEFTVKTTHPRHPVLRVPFFQPAASPVNVQSIPSTKPGQ